MEQRGSSKSWHLLHPWKDHLSRTYLKSLKGKPHVKPLRNRNPPDTFLGRPVVVRVVGRLNLPSVFVNVSPTRSFSKKTREPALERERKVVPGQVLPRKLATYHHEVAPLANIFISIQSQLFLQKGITSFVCNSEFFSYRKIIM